MHLGLRDLRRNPPVHKRLEVAAILDPIGRVVGVRFLSGVSVGRKGYQTNGRVVGVAGFPVAILFYLFPFGFSGASGHLGVSSFGVGSSCVFRGMAVDEHPRALCEQRKLQITRHRKCALFIYHKYPPVIVIEAEQQYFRLVLPLYLL